MRQKNKITKNLIILLIGLIIIYGIGIASFGNIGDQRFTFSDGEEFKKGLFATNSVNQVSQSWIEWTLTYSDGTSDIGRTGKYADSFKTLSLVKSVDDPRILTQADFVVYSDFSTIGNKLCVSTPAMTIKQKVLVNGVQVNVPKQTIVYNEIDARNILKGIGVRITPQFFEGQIQLSNGALKSGDQITFILDANGRFDLSEVNPSTNQCLSTPIADGFIEGIHSEYGLVYGDPLDLLLGTFPAKQTSITDQPVTVNQCVNGVCGEVVIEPSQDTQNQQPITPTDELFCTAEYKPVCANDGKTYSNQCIADSFGATSVYDGICVGEVISDIIDPNPIDQNPTGYNGIVGVCDPLVADCSENSVDIQNYVNEVRQNEFNYNSFEFIMLVIIGIVIISVIASRIVKK